MSDTKTKTKFGFALACALLTTAAFAETKEPTDLSFTDLVATDAQLLDVNGTKVSRDALKGKFVGVYFSASWCGPCRYVTPILKKFRDANNEGFEVVFISIDYDKTIKPRTEQGNLAKKQQYMEEYNMNWYTIHRRYGAALALLRKTGRRGIPTLVIFSPEGKYITNNGTRYLKDVETAIGVWKTKASSIK